MKNSFSIVSLLFAFMFFANMMHAQQTITVCDKKGTNSNGQITIIQEDAITNDIKPAVIVDEPNMQGYRIQVYAGTDRADAQKLKNQMASNYNLPTYMIYEAPYFKVRVGDYRTKLEAQKMFHNLKQSLSGILFVPGTINLPELKQ